MVVSSITGIREPSQQKRKAPNEPATEEVLGETQTVVDHQDDPKEDEKVFPGVAMWVALNAPACHINDVENRIIQVIQSSGLSPVSCKV